MLKSRYENASATPNYEGLDQVSLLVSPSHRHLYVEFLLELIDVQYEPKRATISPDTIKTFIRKIALSTDQETALIELCDARNYSPLYQQLRTLETLLNPVSESKEETKESKH